MGSAFHQLCPRYSGTLTPTSPTAIRLWDIFILYIYNFSAKNQLCERYIGVAILKLLKVVKPKFWFGHFQEFYFISKQVQNNVHKICCPHTGRIALLYFGIGLLFEGVYFSFSRRNEFASLQGI